MKIRKIDHIGIIVNDLAAAKAFFLDFGLEVRGEGEVEDERLDRIVRLNDAHTEFVFMGPPDGQVNLELIKFHHPPDEKGPQQTSANTLGIRHIAFVVEDIEAMIAKLKKRGAEPLSAVQTYENSFKLCYIHGPEGIILELAEEIK